MDRDGNILIVENDSGYVRRIRFNRFLEIHGRLESRPSQLAGVDLEGRLSSRPLVLVY